MKDYNEEIENLTTQRQELAEKLNEIMKARDVQKNLTVCDKEGHVWTLVGVKSTLFEVESISMLCTRCEGQINEPNTYVIGWTENTPEELKTLMGE